jgi:hypothetical protein
MTRKARPHRCRRRGRRSSQRPGALPGPAGTGSKARACTPDGGILSFRKQDGIWKFNGDATQGCRERGEAPRPAPGSRVRLQADATARRIGRLPVDRRRAHLHAAHRLTGPPRPRRGPQRRPVGVIGRIDGRARALGRLCVRERCEGDGEVDGLAEALLPASERGLRTPRISGHGTGGSVARTTRRASHPQVRPRCGEGGEHVFARVKRRSDGSGVLQRNLQLAAGERRAAPEAPRPAIARRLRDR